MMSTELNVTLVQQDIKWEDQAYNLKATRKQLQDITNTDLIILPEMFTTGFSMNPAPIAEPTHGEALAFLQETAKTKQTAITGSIIVHEDGNYYNRLIWVYPNGEYALYDKRHLFRMSEENKHYTAGDSRLIIHYKGWRILPLICYDLRFPVWSRNDAGYDLLLYVANWPQVRAHVWKSLLLARALENQVYVAGVNRVGTDGKGIPFNGNSMMIDAKSNILTNIPEGKPYMETVTISRHELNTFRKKFPVDRDRDAFTLIPSTTYFANETDL